MLSGVAIDTCVLIEFLRNNTENTLNASKD